MNIIFDELICEESATCYNHVVYQIPESIQIDGCTHILESYYGDETLNIVCVGTLVPNNNPRSVLSMLLVPRYYININSLLWDDGGYTVTGINFNGNNSLSETNPYT